MVFHKRHRGKLTKCHNKLQKIKEKYDTNHITLQKTQIFSFIIFKKGDLYLKIINFKNN